MSTIDVANEDLIKNRTGAVHCKSLQESQICYIKWAETYEKEYLSCGYIGHVVVASNVSAMFPPETRTKVRILDIGAGTGLVAKELRKHGFKHIDALDPNATMLDRAREQHLYGNYFQMFITGEPLDIPADTYDVVTGSGIYEENWHVPCEAVFEMIRLVKPGGYIVLSTRHTLVQQTEQYKVLDLLMDQLEEEGKWKKESRQVFPKFYLDIDGIIWCYKVL